MSDIEGKATTAGVSERGKRTSFNQLSRFISLHPYFKVPPDKMPYLKAILPEFAAKTRNETGNLFYEFTINGDEVFCREGYVNAEALRFYEALGYLPLSRKLRKGTAPVAMNTKDRSHARGSETRSSPTSRSTFPSRPAGCGGWWSHGRAFAPELAVRHAAQA